MNTETDDVTFVASCDGSTQRYVRIRPDGSSADQSRDVLIALHGHGFDRWQFPTDDRDECRAVRDAATEHGMLLIAPDYRAPTSWMGPDAESDMVDIIAVLRRRHRISRVFLCGASMGGASVLTFAALHPDLVAGLVAMNGIANHHEFENFQAEISASFGGSKEEVLGEYLKRSAELHAEQFTMPIGLTTGGCDTSTPAESVLRLAERFQHNDSRVLLIHREKGGHSTTYQDAQAVLRFMIRKAR